MSSEIEHSSEYNHFLGLKFVSKLGFGIFTLKKGSFLYHATEADELCLVKRSGRANKFYESDKGTYFGLSPLLCLKAASGNVKYIHVFITKKDLKLADMSANSRKTRSQTGYADNTIFYGRKPAVQVMTGKLYAGPTVRLYEEDMMKICKDLNAVGMINYAGMDSLHKRRPSPKGKRCKRITDKIPQLKDKFIIEKFKAKEYPPVHYHDGTSMVFPEVAFHSAEIANNSLQYVNNHTFSITHQLQMTFFRDFHRMSQTFMNNNITFCTVKSFQILSNISTIEEGYGKFVKALRFCSRNLNYWRNWITHMATHHNKYLDLNFVDMTTMRALLQPRVLVEFLRTSCTYDELMLSEKLSRHLLKNNNYRSNGWITFAKLLIENTNIIIIPLPKKHIPKKEFFKTFDKEHKKLRANIDYISKTYHSYDVKALWKLYDSLPDNRRSGRNFYNDALVRKSPAKRS